MSEELRRGIIKPIPTGEKIEFSEEEKQKFDDDLEKILKRTGVLREDQSIKDLKHLG